MQNGGSVEIDRPIEEVFELTNHHVAEWSVMVVEDEVLHGDGDVGTTFRTVTEENGRRMEFAGVVTRHEPPFVNAIMLSGDSFDIECEYTFEDLGGRTRVQQHSRVTGKGFFRIFLWLFGWAMRRSSGRALENEFASLKRFCEESPVGAG